MRAVSPTFVPSRQDCVLMVEGERNKQGATAESSSEAARAATCRRTHAPWPFARDGPSPRCASPPWRFVSLRVTHLIARPSQRPNHLTPQHREERDTDGLNPTRSNHKEQDRNYIAVRDGEGARNTTTRPLYFKISATVTTVAMARPSADSSTSSCCCKNRCMCGHRTARPASFSVVRCRACPKPNPKWGRVWRQTPFDPSVLRIPSVQCSWIRCYSTGIW